MSVYKKLQEARILLQNTKLNKSGKNKFAGYEYFELTDFLPAIQNICQKVGLCGVVSFTAETAYLTMHDTDGEGFVTFTSPMSTASLKGCHDVQNLGAVQTYLRRYLWTNAFELCEHDALDATTGSESPKKSEAVAVTAVTAGGKSSLPNTINVPEGATATVAVKAPKKLEGEPGDWQMKVTASPDGDLNDWLKLVSQSANLLLTLTSSDDDVMKIFRKNKVVFDSVKSLDPEFFKELMASFTDRKNMFKKG